VFVRVRPPHASEPALSAAQVFTFPDHHLDNRQISLIRAKDKEPTHFTFNAVFEGPSATQQRMYLEASLLVQSAIDGYRVCIFCYGQTGAGKTHTMLGPDHDRGIIPRALQHLFEDCQEKRANGWDYRMVVSMLEIYNEEIRDLLGDGNKRQHTISHDAAGHTTVSDINLWEVNKVKDFEQLYDCAMRTRATGATMMNDSSSRSHCVLRVCLEGSHSESGETRHGMLNLIDLAGSERLQKSGSQGERLKETMAINKSLSSLGEVFLKLSSKDATHIPYRNSKLTFLLQPCLGGNSKTLMVVNVSPTSDCDEESMNSLRFAQMVNKVEIGAARRLGPV